MIQIRAEHGEVHGNAVISFSTCAIELAMEHGVRIRDQDTLTGINILGIPWLLNYRSVFGRYTRGHVVDGTVDVVVDHGIIVEKNSNGMVGQFVRLHCGVRFKAPVLVDVALQIFIS